MFYEKPNLECFLKNHDTSQEKNHFFVKFDSIFPFYEKFVCENRISRSMFLIQLTTFMNSVFHKAQISLADELNLSFQLLILNESFKNKCLSHNLYGELYRQTDIIYNGSLTVSVQYTSKI